jgi:hypothetical protein
LSNSVALQFNRRFEIRGVQAEPVIVSERSEEAPDERKSRDRPKPNSDGLFPRITPQRHPAVRITQLALEDDLRNSRTDMQLVLECCAARRIRRCRA